MKNKSLLIALGASLTFSLANAENLSTSPLQAEQLQSGYTNTNDSFNMTEDKSEEQKGEIEKTGLGGCGDSVCGHRLITP